MNCNVPTSGDRYVASLTIFIDIRDGNHQMMGTAVGGLVRVEDTSTSKMFQAKCVGYASSRLII